MPLYQVYSFGSEQKFQLAKPAALILNFRIGKEDQVERGLIVSLSPNEEATLKRVASGQTEPANYRVQHVERLVNLGLIARTEIGVELTKLGKQRLQKAPQSVGVASDATGLAPSHTNQTKQTRLRCPLPLLLLKWWRYCRSVSLLEKLRNFAYI
jgi:hypothetical protein